jgi:hypothetical protein
MNGPIIFGGGVVVLDDATSSATFAAGFSFARRLRDPGFRSLLKRSGWRQGEHVVMAVDDESVVDVVARITLHETGGRAFIAILDDAQPTGFRILYAEVVNEATGPRDFEPLALGPGASVGMLYSAVGERCGTYVPSEWTSALLFERVTASA